MMPNTCKGEHQWRYRKDLQVWHENRSYDLYEVYYCQRCLQRRYVKVEVRWPANGTTPERFAALNGLAQGDEIQL